MTRARTSGQGIPNRPTNSVLRGGLDTSRTTGEEAPKGEGTDRFGTAGLNYEPLPPVKARHVPAESAYWTMERLLAVLGGVAVLIAVVIFFNRMDSNISDVKADVREEKDKIGKLDEKSNKQTVAIEIVTGAVQRLESETRRTQDYLQEKKR